MTTSSGFSKLRRRFVVSGLALASTTLVHTQNRNTSPMQATLRTDLQAISLVNIFTAEPAAMPHLLDALRQGTETFFSTLPGFVSSSVLAAKDGRQAINYSQWRSAEDIAGFRKDPRFAPYIKQLLALAKVEGIECEIAYVRSA